MKRLIAGLAFLSSAAAFFVIVGGGLALLAVANSGERGSGALLALSGSTAFAAALVIVFAKEGAFAGRGGRAWALTAVLLGVLPSAALSAGALRFSGFPYSSATPRIDLPIFAAGLFFACGAAALLATGYRRLREKAPARARPEAVRPAEHPAEALRPAAEPVRPAELKRPALQPRRPAEAERPLTAHSVGDDEELRATPVELPSIGQFRRR